MDFDDAAYRLIVLEERLVGHVPQDVKDLDVGSNRALLVYGHIRRLYPLALQVTLPEILEVVYRTGRLWIWHWLNVIRRATRPHVRQMSLQDVPALE